MNIQIRKKDDTLQAFNADKIIVAITKSAERAMVELSKEDEQKIVEYVLAEITARKLKIVPIKTMHFLVEAGLENVNDVVAKSYRDYRNYKTDFIGITDKVYQESQKIRYIGDKENSNTDSALVATKRSLIYNELNKALYQKFFLSTEERQATKDGYIWIHDMVSRLDTLNCCLFDMEAVLTNGFEMANIWYNEPKSILTAFTVMGDVILSTAAQQYGGFTVYRVDQFMAKYAQKSYDKIFAKYRLISDAPDEDLDHYATSEVEREIAQGWQGLEYKLNTVGSSRGDYPFVTVTAGLGTGKWEKLITKIMFNVRENGQGKDGFRKPVLFPKLVFLYDEALHGVGKINEDLFEEAVKCSSKAMYPDYLSLTGEGYVPSMYQKYGQVVSPMGCRAFLSPWYKKGGMYPADNSDTPVFEGRWNAGAISLNLPMIYQKAITEDKDFYQVLDYFLEMIRGIHKKTYEYLANLKASVNPMAFCEGGFYGGTLKPQDRIRPLLKSTTFSFGITALNELQQLHNKHSIYQDNTFVKEVMEYINHKATVEFKNADNILYAIYGTPAESLCGRQVTQFRKKYGVVEGVSDRDYVSNSFHCHVTEKISPVQKQDKEVEMWNLFNGGKIQYVRYNIGYNLEAIKTYVRRAMKKGFYEGVNLALSYCDNCGYEELEMEVCPKCGSNNLTKIDRMNGYLSYSRVKGDSRLNDSKMAEIGERTSM